MIWNIASFYVLIMYYGMHYVHCTLYSLYIIIYIIHEIYIIC